MKPSVSPLNGSDWALLREQIATVKAILKKRYGQGELDQTLEDLRQIQRLVDDGVFDPSEIDNLRALGAVYGNVLQKQLGLEWVADDGRTREPALQLKTAPHFVLHPLRTVVTKTEAGGRVDFEQLFKLAKADVAKNRLI